MHDADKTVAATLKRIIREREKEVRALRKKIREIIAKSAELSTHNPLLKTFADRLIEHGRKPKQAIIAVMRKLLHRIYGIPKSGQPYNSEKRGFAGT